MAGTSYLKVALFANRRKVYGKISVGALGWKAIEWNTFVMARQEKQKDDWNLGLSIFDKRRHARPAKRRFGSKPRERGMFTRDRLCALILKKML